MLSSFNDVQYKIKQITDSATVHLMPLQHVGFASVFGTSLLYSNFIVNNIGRDLCML